MRRAIIRYIRRLPIRGPLTLLVVAALLAGIPYDLQGQTTTRRDVLTSGSGETSGPEHSFRGSLSQSAVGRLTRGIPSPGVDAPLHLAGFWYVGYRPDIITRVSFPRIETNLETEITLPLQLETEGAVRPFAPRPFTARIRFNATLLFPIGRTPPCIGSDGFCTIEIADTARVENGTIYELTFLTILGDAESTPVEIVDFTWGRRGEERISVLKEPGEVRLLDLCREGDSIRLIRSGTTSRLAIRPNPARTSTTIDFSTNQRTNVELVLVDLLGKEVLRTEREEIRPDVLYSRTIDITRLPSGSYLLLCRTGAGVMSQRLIIPE